LLAVLKVAHGSQLSNVDSQSAIAPSENAPETVSAAANSRPQSASLARVACRNSCDASGYSISLAGEAAAKACIDVCLSEDGDASASTAQSTPTANSAVNDAENLIAGLGHDTAVSGSGKLIGKQSGSLRTLISKEGVDEDKLPQVRKFGLCLRGICLAQDRNIACVGRTQDRSCRVQSSSMIKYDTGMVVAL
jgi:hypothetical protein